MLPWLSLTGGVRTSRVKYDSDDHYVVGPNPDDSGARTYTNTSPIAGIVWHATDTLNVYVSYGQGFETPTFAELAYRPVGAGLNLALDPATSTSVEVGLKWLPTPKQRLNVAVFAADTDQEIVVDTATGGRTTYRNAGKTRRRGFEAAWDADLGSGFTAHANYSYLNADVRRCVRHGPAARRGTRRRAPARRSAATGLRGARVDARRLLRIQRRRSRCSTSADSTPTTATRRTRRRTRSATRA